MKNKVHAYLRKPTIVISIILISSVLSYLTGGLGYIFGIAVALITFWASNYNWIEFGIGKLKWRKTFVRAVLYAMLIFIVMDLVIQPFVELHWGSIDLSQLDSIRSNFGNYLMFVVFMWIVAAFGEEFLYRGFFMKRFAEILGGTNRDWLISAFAISTLFGMAHLYQGISGMITTGLIGLILSIIFYKNRDNLTLNILIHGIYNMIGITLIYLDRERMFIDWVLQYL
ncbi:CPBP family intramembrane glutamic endopeptidase [Fodinibius halophilus]|uniref:CPBP family intramembrane metalloprotease n=1 Tax=Fodinibius halophilus TaxID=1736908 RepID=A0A6M1T739_9BACT|nr:CPBP family intramembrane glutamic endopeptidase [Fodinibius halophilus]NGP89929.1 CPBP family intramembrane metalloprotease [Fodinibius halophilus]